MYQSRTCPCFASNGDTFEKCQDNLVDAVENEDGRDNKEYMANYEHRNIGIKVVDDFKHL